MTLTGCTGKDLANLLHISPASVSRALSLLELDPGVQEQVASGEISPRAGAAIARIRNPKAQQDVAQCAVVTKAPTVEVEQQVRRQRQGTSAKPQPFVQFKIARGVRVVIHGRLDGARVVAALEAAVELARAELDRGEEQGEAGARVKLAGPLASGVGQGPVAPHPAVPLNICTMGS